MSAMYTTVRVDEVAEVIAPDGSAVRPLCALPAAGSFAQFELAPGKVSKAVSHATVQEIWYVVAGSGRMWRSMDGHAEVTSLDVGVCLTIPLGTAFQFRANEDGLRVVAATIPPWPGDRAEARPEPGPW
jgi:mannose-6-phosphate isomerase-like protein (cupin superfamily)